MNDAVVEFQLSREKKEINSYIGIRLKGNEGKRERAREEERDGRLVLTINFISSGLFAIGILYRCSVGVCAFPWIRKIVRKLTWNLESNSGKPRPKSGSIISHIKWKMWYCFEPFSICPMTTEFHQSFHDALRCSELTGGTGKSLRKYYSMSDGQIERYLNRFFA